MASQTPFMLFDRAGAGPLMAIRIVGGGFSTFLYSWSADHGSVDSMLPLGASGSCGLSYAWTEVLSNGMLASVTCGQPSTGAVQLHVSIPQESSVIGVALEAVAPGARVRVATAGKFAAPVSMGSATFDRRHANPPGTRGVVVADTVVLSGLVD